MKPRVLVTGFEPFPGAPVNPTQALVEWLRDDPPAIGGLAAFSAELLPVDYAGIGPRLSEIGRVFAPDIAIQFGLAASSRGFRLERSGRNSFADAAPDNWGARPDDGPICGGPPLLPATLPLRAIHRALSGAGLPVEWSDDAGGYLCNMAMTLALAGACGGFRPRWSGFIHVSPVGEGAPLAEAAFRRGALIVVETVCAEWQAMVAAGASVADQAGRQHSIG
ncbi:MAG: hypothetical protein KF914_15365 [Rhizobiaceae bacterium]|nr:hypothetical protein [Rhizobiaceae bacterium]